MSGGYLDGVIDENQKAKKGGGLQDENCIKEVSG
jgi:hypothetical protein